jgi:hypothetical protein
MPAQLPDVTGRVALAGVNLAQRLSNRPRGLHASGEPHNIASANNDRAIIRSEMDAGTPANRPGISMRRM